MLILLCNRKAYENKRAVFSRRTLATHNVQFTLQEGLHKPRAELLGVVEVAILEKSKNKHRGLVMVAFRRTHTLSAARLPVTAQPSHECAHPSDCLLY